MAEIQIPETLVESIREGRAALVVGSNIGALAGMPSWKKLLERLRDALKERGQEGDAEAAEDVSSHLKKGRLLTAARFLARSLGGPTCDQIVSELWKTPEPIPEGIQVLGRIPIKAIWTVHPTDIVERAVQAGNLDGWPVPQVASYETAGELDTRRRYVLKLLGEIDKPESYVVLPKNVRRALAGREEVRAILSDLYTNGTLLFVGFRHGDPDLHALLERVFGSFEPPKGEHFFVSPGLSPVDIDDLSAEHELTVIPLEGKGGDAEPLGDYLEALARACEGAGLTLAVTRPEADDLEGWLAVLAEDATCAEALDAIRVIEDQARSDGDAERLTEVLLARIDVASGPGERVAILKDLARTYEEQVGDLPRAFTALSAAVREDPTDEETLSEAERLAGETDGWGELVAELSEIVPAIEDRGVAAGLWVRLGRWYHEKLHHHDYAIASYREALKLDEGRLPARGGLVDLYRKQQKWGELAEEIEIYAQGVEDVDAKIRLFLELGELQESQLASTSKAIEAYERALQADPASEDALLALERLYRRSERWGKLANVLEKRAEILEPTEPSRAAQLRKELAQLRSDKLGDVEGAIARYERALEANEGDVDALRELEKLYDKAGRLEDYFRVLERLAEVAPEHERPALWRRLAAEIEDREGGAARAIEYYVKVLEIEPQAVDAYRSLGRLLRAEQRWDDLIELYERHIAQVTAPAQRLELYVSLANLYEKELHDPHRAIDAHLNALDIPGGSPTGQSPAGSPEADHRESLAALGRLYTRVEKWDEAVSILTKLADLEGAQGATYWHQAGILLLEKLDDSQGAEEKLSKALEIDPRHLPSLKALIELYKKRRDFGRAARTMLEAERQTQNRLEKIQLLHEAARIHDEWLEKPDAATDLYARVLALDPEHTEAGAHVAERWVELERWSEAMPVLEMLARKTDPQDRVEKARWEALVGRAAEAEGDLDKAQRHYRLAHEADSESLEASLGLASLLFRREEWAEAEKLYREILARHRHGLAEGQLVDIWHRIGLTLRAKGEDRKAEDAFRRALERDPGHRPSLDNVVELASARKDWAAVIEAKRSSLDTADDEGRYRLFVEIGDLYAQNLEDPVSALGVYLEALKLRSDSHVVLHKALDIYTEQKQWRHAVDTLDKIAELEKDPSKRAKYYYAAAVIVRDEIQAPEESVEYFTKALDDAPTLPKAFTAIERILGDKGDWKGLQRAYRKMIKRIGERATDEQLLQLWSRLAEISDEKLKDRESAIAAYEVVETLSPRDVATHERLADLYLQAGPDRADKAIESLQILVKQFPDRLDLYKALSRLYAQTGQDDKAYCLASALSFLGQAGPEEVERFQRRRPERFMTAKRRLTEELWQKAIIHPREDRVINGIFASLMGPLAATTAQPRSALDLNPKEQADPEKDPHLVARIFRYAVTTMGIDPQPELYLRKESPGGIQAANVAEKGYLRPAVLIGGPYLQRRPEPDLAFEVSKKLAFFRPERYVYYAMATLPRLETAVCAALKATGRLNGTPTTGDIDKLAGYIKDNVPGAVLEQVANLAGRLQTHEVHPLVTSWLTATDLTANRVGLILANDLETAARIIATEQNVLSSLSAKERLRELLVYSVSEEYFNVRRHLGFDR